MKKAVLLVVLAMLSIGASLFAQQHQESDYYYFSVPIERIYTHRLGYIVGYQKGLHEIAHVYIPHDWFTGAGGKGEIVTLGPGNEWPYMTLFYKNGIFSHVRLKLRSRIHQTWGVLPLNVNLDDHFMDVYELRLEY